MHNLDKQKYEIIIHELGQSVRQIAQMKINKTSVWLKRYNETQ